MSNSNRQELKDELNQNGKRSADKGRNNRELEMRPFLFGFGFCLILVVLQFLIQRI